MSLSYPDSTEQTADRRNTAAQLVSGLAPREFLTLLTDAQGLKQLPAAPGRSTFTGTVELDSFASTSVSYAPALLQSYLKAGIKTDTFTVGFDDRARPTMLREHLSSDELSVDYQLTITGYTAAKVTAPI